MLCSFRDRVASNLEKTDKKQVSFQNSMLDAIVQLDKGSSAYWDIMSSRLQESLIKSSELLNLIKEIEPCVKILNKKHERVVDVLLKIQYETRELEVIVQFYKLFTNIVASNSIHAKAVMHHLFKRLKPCASKLVVEQEILFDLAQKTILDILTFLPDVIHDVPQLIYKHLPFNQLPLIVHESFFKNLLALAKKRQELRISVLEVMTRQILDMDVQISKEDIALIEAEKENLKEGEADKKIKKKADWLEKVDSLMHLYFVYLKEESHDNGNLHVEKANLLHIDLTIVFEQVVLPVRDIKYTQYILFYFLSFKQSFSDIFIDALWRKVVNYKTSQLTCQLCMAYIGSLLSRSKYVPLSTVTAFLSSVVPWLHKYIDLKESSEIDLSKSIMYGKFYSVCQTVFYVIVFRHKQLLDNPKGHTFIEGLNIGRIVTCSLNPLRYCQPTVVSLFAAIMRQHQLVYCNTIIEQNKRNFIPNADENQKPNPLESFFPFDPVHLPKCSEHINIHYQSWEGSLPEDVMEEASIWSHDNVTSKLGFAKIVLRQHHGERPWTRRRV